VLRRDTERTGQVISTREAEVLEAVGEHLSNAEIAARLFISVRTVESHVSSLLRKLQVDDRRALGALARLRDGDGGLARPDRSAGMLTVPSPLTPFVGRAAERAALADALRSQRLVTAIGPGGVGKTRLALSVLDEVRDGYADGTWFVDLSPLSDPASVAPAIACALGLGEHHARSAEESLLDWLAARQVLLVVDNCEHVLDGVVVVLERLLAGSAGLTVLATSRSRLLASFEWAFPVPGLSTEGADGGPGDAVALFVGRAAAAGVAIAPDDLSRVAAICRGLDGMALAIELAAARLPSLGFDGVEAALADPLALLTGAPRVNDRHRSLRATLDWSYRLLDVTQRAVLRRISVFASRFTVEAAAALVDGWTPARHASVADVLAGLADQSLLVAVAERRGTRYRLAATIRQYAGEQLDRTGEYGEAQRRYLGWCLAEVTALGAAYRSGESGGWRVDLDRIADDVRAALRCPAPEPRHRAMAHELAERWAELAFLRGWLAESQRCYELAASLASGDASAADALRRAAGAAESRHFGDEALRLLRAAAGRAVQGGDRAAAARDLARTAELMRRAPGLLTTAPSSDAVERSLARAWQLVTDDAATQARVLVAEAFRSGSQDPLAGEFAERAAALARRAGDRLIESAALDQVTTAHLTRGELPDAAATARQRLTVLAPVPITAMSAVEHADAVSMVADTALAVGDLATSRESAELLRRLPFHREDGHLANARLLVVEVVAGAFDEVLALAECYRDSWVAAGRPRAGNLSRAAYAAATAHGLRGDEPARAEWLRVAAAATPARRIHDTYFGQFFDALLALHRGEPVQATGVLHLPRGPVRDCQNGMWRPWYAAVWAEAAVLTGRADAVARLGRARELAAANRVAAVLVERAAALATGDRSGLVRAAEALAAAGCRYQWARTLTLLGGRAAARGAEALDAMGVTAPVWPAQLRRAALAEPA
jgi:predicted ATPase/DNA-binding CsgD family transcriptional regulator